MMNAKTTTLLWRDLLDNVNFDTLLPKFPSRATECVRELAEIAREQEECMRAQEAALRDLTEDGSPELIFYAALIKTAKSDIFDSPFEYLPYMPLLEKALDTQRRCRVCGCTDYNGCICGCAWIEDDLCSECAATLEGGNGDG